jgi:TonB family protein
MTNKHMRGPVSVLIVAFCVQASFAHAQGAAALMDRLQRANASNSIDDAQMKPWHLKMSFQLFDAKGAPTEKGTVEEWWAEPLVNKTVYTSPSYTNTDIQTRHGLYRSRGVSSVPSVLELVLQQVLYPMPSEQDIADSKPELREHDFGKAKMDCILLTQEISDVGYSPWGLFPTYCFDKGQDSLRLSFDFGSQLTVRNRVGTFQGRNVAVDQTTSSGAFKVATAHLDLLETMTVNDADMVPSAELEPFNPDHMTVSPAAAAALLLNKVNPIYPENAREHHVSGAVILFARIGSDGRIHSLRVASTPDGDLAIAAVDAVRRWIYKPYLLDGRPVDINTKITVNFAFSR